MTFYGNFAPKQGYYGQFSTDALIELYFPDKVDGVCVEVGAANGVRGSNTLLFEKKGWRTLCIEPNPEYFQEVKKIRKEAVQYACGASNKKSIPFTVFKIGDNNIMSSLSGLKPDARLIEEYDNIINDTYQINVECKTLNSLLLQEGFPDDIDFISIDTEGSELDV